MGVLDGAGFEVDASQDDVDSGSLCKVRFDNLGDLM